MGRPSFIAQTVPAILGGRNQPTAGAVFSRAASAMGLLELKERPEIFALPPRVALIPALVRRPECVAAWHCVPLPSACCDGINLASLLGQPRGADLPQVRRSS